MRTFLFLLFGWALPVGFITSESHAAEPRVEFEIVTEQGLTPVTTQKWFQMLTELKVDGLRIRSAKPTDEINIEDIGSKDRPLLRVTGRIDARGSLLVPGGRFGVSDRAGIARWIRELANNGVEGVTSPKAAFGLTGTQLSQATDDLSRSVRFSTKGVKALEAARTIVASLKLETVVADEVKQALSADDPVRDELKDLSSGTALAAILRPAGAALVPIKPAGAPVQYRLILAEGASEAWPIGRPVEKQPAKVVPKLFEFLNAEISGVTAREAISAIEGRLGVPVLFDHNNMARHNIDLEKEVAVPAKRTYYSKVLEQVLYKSGLKYELRADENGKPFLWITTLKR